MWVIQVQCMWVSITFMWVVQVYISCAGIYYVVQVGCAGILCGLSMCVLCGLCRYMYHYMSWEGVVYLCITDDVS